MAGAVHPSKGICFNTVPQLVKPEISAETLFADKLELLVMVKKEKGPKAQLPILNGDREHPGSKPFVR